MEEKSTTLKGNNHTNISDDLRKGEGAMKNINIAGSFLFLPQ